MVDKKQISGVMVLTAFITAMFTGAIIQDNTTTYLCEDTQQICIGTKLSSTAKTCYYLENGTERMKRCSTLWIPYVNEDIGVQSSRVGVYGNGCMHWCPVESEEVGSYTVCTCDNGKYAYMGELI